jgi:3',5'-cyclic AMP phosphodiesterase CpdA
MAEQQLLSFWAFGDLHFRAWDQWQAIHTPRMTQMFTDLHTVWQKEGPPAFCVSPGDIVDTGAPAHYALAKRELAAQLGAIPLYQGIGNHEFHPDGPEDSLHTSQEFSDAWGRPVRYSWTAGANNEVLCIMLDQPDPFLPGQRSEYPHVIFSDESLAFLEQTLAQHPEQMAIIFAHCPLHNTVLDRDPVRNMDYDSLEPFFFVENSDKVRAILAQHRHAGLYISGHTHSGWGSPQLVFTEMLEGHPVTHLNLMSPWFTGRSTGPHMNTERTRLEYRADTPDVIVTFSLRIYPGRAIIRARDHKTQTWLDRWEVPLR